MIIRELICDNEENKASKDIDNFDSRIKKHCKTLSDTASMISCRDNDLQSEESISLENKLLTESFTIKSMCQDYLMQRGHSSLVYDYEKDKVSVKIDSYLSGYKFVFSELFPARGNIINKSVLKGYLRTIDWDYKVAIEEEIKKYKEKVKLRFFRERVAVVVTHFFSDEKQLRDYDNFESKPITDLITFHFVKDDSPEYVSVHFNYERTSDKTHSEIIIIPEREYYEKRGCFN